MASLRRVMPSSWRASRRLLSRVTAMWANSLTGRTSCDLLIAQCATRQGRALLIPAGRTGDGSIGRLRRSGGIVFGDAAVPAPLSIRTDRAPAELRRLARRERDGRVSARLLALANALDGLPREEAAKLAGMTGQTLGDWVHRYNTEGVEGLRERPRPGRPCALDEGQQATL